MPPKKKKASVSQRSPGSEAAAESKATTTSAPQVDDVSRPSPTKETAAQRIDGGPRATEDAANDSPRNSGQQAVVSTSAVERTPVAVAVPAINQATQEEAEDALMCCAMQLMIAAVEHGWVGAEEDFRRLIDEHAMLLSAAGQRFVAPADGEQRKQAWFHGDSEACRLLATATGEFSLLQFLKGSPEIISRSATVQADIKRHVERMRRDAQTVLGLGERAAEISAKLDGVNSGRGLSRTGGETVCRALRDAVALRLRSALGKPGAAPALLIARERPEPPAQVAVDQTDDEPQPPRPLPSRPRPATAGAVAAQAARVGSAAAGHQQARGAEHAPSPMPDEPMPPPDPSLPTRSLTTYRSEAATPTRTPPMQSPVAVQPQVGGFDASARRSLTGAVVRSGSVSRVRSRSPAAAAQQAAPPQPSAEAAVPADSDRARRRQISVPREDDLIPAATDDVPEPEPELSSSAPARGRSRSSSRPRAVPGAMLPPEPTRHVFCPVCSSYHQPAEVFLVGCPKSDDIPQAFADFVDDWEKQQQNAAATPKKKKTGGRS